MQIGLLGELKVLGDDDVDIVVTGAKMRALVAILALHVGRPVPTDQLVDALWGEDPPPAVRNGLQGLVSKLRRALGSTDVVAMRGGGYALELDPTAVDVHRYEQLVTEAREAAVDGDHAGAIRRLTAAELLWRGDPLIDFTYEQFASTTIGRLTELRVTAIEERLDLEMQVGGHQGVIGELELLVTAHPLRERPRGLLMVALYRAGRQADALRVFQDGRRILGDELGLDPGPDLRKLEAAILAQDPTLDAPSAGPAAVALADVRPTIPESLTPLLGRDAEVEVLTQLITESRLVTLVGSGGVGKTRLALEAARGASNRFSFGACLVELAPVGDPAAVPAAIASALNLPDPSRISEIIGERDMLIILDNCEHLISTAAEIAEDLLRRCPSLHLLATSREGLRVNGETIWPVPPLRAGDAVQLFAERARAGGAQLDLSDDVVLVITDICARLDGLPLAIELAASRTRAFPVSQLASRLNDRFRLLTGGSRTALPRQQTLRAVVDWSYELLFDDEQRLFERLSVFPGGCDLATAEAVCADDGLPVVEIADLIQALVDKSLVGAVTQGDQLRFTQLQTLADYGREKLAERGDGERIRDAMAAHYARLCGQSAAAFIGDHQRAWLTTMEKEHDNIRAALEWAVAADDAETAITIAGGASWKHWLGGTVIEGRRWLDDAFATPGDVSEAIRGLGLIGRGLIDFLTGSPDGSDTSLEAALTIFRGLDDLAGLVLAHTFYAEFAVALGDVHEARRRRSAVLSLYLDLPDDPFVIAVRSWAQAKLATLNDDLVEAEKCYREAADGFGRIDRPVMYSIALGMVADFDERAGNYRAAIDELEAAIQTNSDLGLRGFTGNIRARLGWLLLLEGETERAEAAFREALELGRWLRNESVVFLALAGSAAFHRLEGRIPAAAAAASEALGIYHASNTHVFRNRIDEESEWRAAAATCCEVLGMIAADDHDPEEAAKLLGHAERLRRDVGVPVPAFQHGDVLRAQEAAASALGRDAFAAAFDKGRTRVSASAAPRQRTPGW
jgi:predicted ATPase/DNA-binding SARP family transcriptional activator/tetratricopeptide (TPR) repeat protein